MLFQLEPSTKIILKVIFVLVALAFLWAVRDILMLLVLSVILASALEPLVEYFNKRRVPRAVSVLAVYILALAFVGLVLYLLIPPAAQQLRLLASKWPQYIGQIEGFLPSQLVNPSSINDVFRALFSSAPGNGLLSQTFGVFSGVLSVFTVLVISFYLVAEERGMKKFISDLIPAPHQELTMSLIEKIQKKMGLWVIGQIFLSFAVFALTYIGLTALGVDYALFLALLAGLLEIVPYLGPILAAIPAAFFAFTQSPALGLAVLLLYVLIQKIENYLLTPKIMARTVGTSPLVVLIALLVGFKLAGIVGLLIAVPIASAITVVVNELSAPKVVSTATSSKAEIS